MVFATIKKEPSTGRLMAVQEDGSSFYISVKLSIQMHLHELMELDEDQTAALKEATEGENCYNKALGLLAMQEHCKAGLRDKLRQKGFSKSTIEQQIQLLIDEGSLDEERYAKAFIQSRLRKKIEGRSMMANRLSAKSVDSQASNDALDQFYSPELVSEYIEQLADKTGLKNEELKLLLKKRGFTSYEISQYFRTL